MCPRRTSCRERAPQSWWPRSTSQMSHPGPAGSSMEATSTVPHCAAKEWVRWAEPHRSITNTVGHNRRRPRGRAGAASGADVEVKHALAPSHTPLQPQDSSRAQAAPVQHLLPQPWGRAPCKMCHPPRHAHSPPRAATSSAFPPLGTAHTRKGLAELLGVTTGADTHQLLQHQPWSEHSTRGAAGLWEQGRPLQSTSSTGRDGGMERFWPGDAAGARKHPPLALLSRMLKCSLSNFVTESLHQTTNMLHV